MGFRDANRAQAIQVGAILIFAIIILLLSVYQATVIPQQNARIEFNAYQAATDDMVSVRNDVVTAATEGSAAGTVVQTGATYPARTVFVNPGTPTGTLSTAPTEPVRIDGVQAVESEPENVERFWNATPRTYDTSRLTFTPSYNEFDGPPVVLSQRSVYRTPDTRVLPVSAETFVDGNRITLVTIRGDLDTAGVSTAVTAEPVSTATRTVVVTGTGSTFNVTVPTPGSATAWNQSVGETVVANPNVVTTTPNANETVTVTFDGSRRYELRLAAVELRGRSDASTVPRPDPAYVVPVTQNGTVVADQPTPVTVEVRDRYDNPVSGTEVNFTLVDGQGQFAQGGTTRIVAADGEGRATVALRPASNYDGNLTVRAQGDFDGNGTVEPIERTDIGLSAGTGDGEPDINEERGGVKLGTSVAGSSGNSNLVDLVLNNTADEERIITDARVAFYFTSGQDAGDSPELWEVNAPITSSQYEVGAPLQPLDDEIVLDPDSETTITFEFNQPAPKTSGDFFILTVEYRNFGTATYYVAVED